MYITKNNNYNNNKNNWRGSNTNNYDVKFVTEFNNNTLFDNARHLVLSPTEDYIYFADDKSITEGVKVLKIDEKENTWSIDFVAKC